MLNRRTFLTRLTLAAGIGLVGKVGAEQSVSDVGEPYSEKWMAHVRYQFKYPDGTVSQWFDSSPPQIGASVI